MSALVLALVLQTARIAEPVEIRVVADEAWGQVNPQDIKAVLQSTSKELLKFFPDRKLNPIIVEHSAGLPVTLYEPGPQGEIRIKIASKETLWSQFAYQFSHELTHVLAGYERVEPNSLPNMWFEESLCMMGSLFTMRQMSKTWKRKPPFPHWKSYAPHLGAYADNVMQDPKHQLPPNTGLAQWYRANEEKLRYSALSDADGRARQSVVANVLLPLFEESPEGWPAIGFLNMKKTGDSSFKTYLDAWEESAPKKYGPFIKRIRARFETP